MPVFFSIIVTLKFHLANAVIILFSMLKKFMYLLYSTYSNKTCTMHTLLFCFFEEEKCKSVLVFLSNKVQSYANQNKYTHTSTKA